ncbi:Fe-S protein assembly co-chaperone HscB [Faucicola atlantae]|uniref:Fe-S protein assembly co-chaperone HscB n=1 Tax=Faucicola atlantae TaxID=34059 RepID=UPI0025B0C7B0|nr:Fe-S protein assembly co-chaperone HscB [Moraxella atlantae]
MVNYFALMGMPTDFALDEGQLAANLRCLQQQYHPDMQSGDGQAVPTPAVQTIDLSHLNAEQQSALINTAYHTLKSVDSRALHLLALRGLTLSPNASIADGEFLARAMEFRIELEEADNTSLPTLKAELNDWLGQNTAEFAAAYAELVALPEQVSVDHPMAKRALAVAQRLQFLVKVLQDVAKTADQLAQADDDTDLYV